MFLASVYGEAVDQDCCYYPSGAWKVEPACYSVGIVVVPEAFRPVVVSEFTGVASTLARRVIGKIEKRVSPVLSAKLLPRGSLPVIAPVASLTFRVYRLSPVGLDPEFRNLDWAAGHRRL